jgi:hypothetical protein
MIGLRMAATALAQTKSLHGVEPWLRGLLDRHDHIVLLCVGPYLSVFVVGHGTALADLPPPRGGRPWGENTYTIMCASYMPVVAPTPQPPGRATTPVARSPLRPVVHVDAVRNRTLTLIEREDDTRS